MPKLRWLWTFFALVWAVTFPYYLDLNRELSTLLLSQPVTGQPVVDQMKTLTLIFGTTFGLAVVLTLVSWCLWAVERPKPKTIP